MTMSLRLPLLCFFTVLLSFASAQCPTGQTLKNFSNYTETGTNTGTAEMSGSCVMATWSHTGAARGEDYGADIRFKTSVGDNIVYDLSFSEALTNPIVSIGDVKASSSGAVTIQNSAGVVIASQTLVAGSGDIIRSGNAWIGTAGEDNGKVQLTGSYSALKIIITGGTNDGIDIDLEACVADAPTAPTPSYVAAIACPANHKIYTVVHTDATSGTLHGGINVTTAITGTRNGSLDFQTIGNIGNVDPNVPTNITSGGLLQFKMTDDGDDFAVKYTFSQAVTNSFIYIGDTGPETATVYKIFELDGTTPIPVGLIDGQVGFITSGNQIGTNKNNVSGYVQIQDNVARLGFVIQVINGVNPPCFVGTADADEGGDDAFRIAVGGCRPDQMTIGGVTASIDNEQIVTSNPFDLNVTGLTNMKMSVNGQKDFGLNFYLYPNGTGPSDFDYPPSNAITLDQVQLYGSSITVPVLIGQLTSAQLTNNCTEGTLSNIVLPSGFPMEDFSVVTTLDANPNGFPATSFVLPSVNVATVPTLGEWGIIVLTLSMMIMGLVAIREQKLMPTTA